MYDEPTAGLDPVASTVVEDLVRSLTVGGDEGSETESSIVTEDGGIAAYIVVTHQHSTIRRSVDRLIFLHEVSGTDSSRQLHQMPKYSCLWLFLQRKQLE